MGSTGKCPHCKKDVYLGIGFAGPYYKGENGRPFEPVTEEKCPFCGGHVKEGGWQEPSRFIQWD
jgi:hypothetical protein